MRQLDDSGAHVLTHPVEHGLELEHERDRAEAAEDVPTQNRRLARQILPSSSARLVTQGLRIDNSKQELTARQEDSRSGFAAPRLPSRVTTQKSAFYWTSKVRTLSTKKN